MAVSENRYEYILFEAAKLNDFEIVSHIIEKKLCPQAGETLFLALDASLAHSSDDMFKLLFEYYRGKKHEKLLIECISWRQLDCTKMVLQRMKDEDIIPKIKNNFFNENNGLMWNLIYLNELKFFQVVYDYIYKDRLDFEKINKVGSDYLKYESLTFLHQHGFQIKNFSTSFDWAISLDHVKTVKYILKNDLLKGNVNSCLKTAVKHDALKCIDYFLKEGANVDYVLKFGSEKALNYLKHEELKKLNQKLTKNLPSNEVRTIRSKI